MVSRVKQWLVERAGLDPELLQRDWLDRLIERRLRQLDVPSEDRYCLLLQQDPAERDRLIREVSVGETSFFRYPSSYELLVQHLRQIREASGGRLGLRMLSVACASGEEPYSMAIAALHAGWPRESVAVDAVDRNTGALAAARDGRYPAQRAGQPFPSWASPWLRVESDRLCVAAALKPAVHFVCADAVAAPDSLLPGPYAVVFCRNLLIYLHEEARARLIDKLAGWLESGGLLFVGHAEQLQSLQSRFEIVSYPGAFALRRREPAADEDRRLPAGGVALPGALMASGRSSHRSTSAAHLRLDADGAGGAAGILEQRGSDAPCQEPRSGDASGLRPASVSRSLIERARTAADQGRLEAALAEVQTALQASDPSAELYQLLGSIQLSRGRLPEARDALRRAVYLDPDHEESLLQLALVHQRLGDAAHAARYRKRAARAHQNHAGGSE